MLMGKLELGNMFWNMPRTCPKTPKGAKCTGPAPRCPAQPLLAKESHIHTKTRSRSFKYYKQHEKPTLGSWLKHLTLDVYFDSESCSQCFQHSPANLHNLFEHCLPSVTLTASLASLAFSHSHRNFDFCQFKTAVSENSQRFESCKFSMVIELRIFYCCSNNVCIKND